jgi:energy-converting hydrogenase Eha subunit F
MMSKFMGNRPRSGIFSRIKNWLVRQPAPLSDIDQARQLIAAVDRGGIPLNPAKVNTIARNLGLEVSRHAPVENTLERIRQALSRV